MNESEIRARLDQMQACLNAMVGLWPFVVTELEAQRLQRMESLVTAEDPELRGRIKQIADLIALPQYLRSEIENWNLALPKTGAF